MFCTSFLSFFTIIAVVAPTQTNESKLKNSLHLETEDMKFSKNPDDFLKEAVLAILRNLESALKFLTESHNFSNERMLEILLNLKSESQKILKNSHFSNESVLSNLLKLQKGDLQFLKDSYDFSNQETHDTTPQNEEVYDFVIVGAGTAGATIAARLSEIPEVKVLLIEAGGSEKYFMDIPLLPFLLQLSDKINWKYYTKPSNKYCLGMTNNQCHFPRGKVMGGSSVLNFMFAARGSDEDYDRWAEMGNEGWAYKDVLKYFKKLETMDIPELRNSTYHGTEGPVHISYAHRGPVTDQFVKAGLQLGYPSVDYNSGKNTIGFSYIQGTIKNGSRMSSNRAYLHPIRDRKNLYVTQNSMVSKVLIDRNTSRAIGVQFTKNQQTISVFASKEVILCAGAIGSPQLLMLSGIGPRKHLTDLGINVVRDSPVGHNLIDHVYYPGLGWIIDKPLTIRSIDMFNVIQNSFLADYFLTHTGPFTSLGTAEAVGFYDTEHPEKRTGSPNIELLFMNSLIKGEPLFQVKSILNLNNETRQLWSNYTFQYGYNIMVVLLHPKSRGKIRLLANDVNVKPEIIPNYFDDPEDIRTMIKGIKMAINISNTEAMQVFNPKLFYDVCSNYTYDSYDYWECAMRTLSFTLYHYAGTCKMGPIKDPTAVVDPKLKVIGVKSLRVIDSSIMSNSISGHINLPTFMIAEKGADIIKEEWGYTDPNYTVEFEVL